MVKGTTPTQIRLTDSDKVAIEAIRQAFGLPSMASAVRLAIQYVVQNHPGMAAKDQSNPKGHPRKKRQK